MINLLAIADLLSQLAEVQSQNAALLQEMALHFDPSLHDPDAIVLGRAIQGEGAARFGPHRDEVAIWIAHVAYNRWQQPYWKRIDGVDCTFGARVEKDWHGTQNVSEEDLQPWARRIAYQVLRERGRGGIDRANGALFAMTLDDLRTHEWAERALDVVIHVINAPDDPNVQYWFLTDYPGPEEED